MNMHYGDCVLVPLAMQFRISQNRAGARFKLYSMDKVHRVEFIDEELENLWVEFCEFQKLSNDTSIRY